MNLPTIILFTVTAIVIILGIVFMVALIHAVEEELLPALEKAAREGEYPQLYVLKMEKTRDIF